MNKKAIFRYQVLQRTAFFTFIVCAILAVIATLILAPITIGAMNGNRTAFIVSLTTLFVGSSVSIIVLNILLLINYKNESKQRLCNILEIVTLVLPFIFVLITIALACFQETVHYVGTIHLIIYLIPYCLFISAFCSKNPSLLNETNENNQLIINHKKLKLQKIAVAISIAFCLLELLGAIFGFGVVCSPITYGKSYNPYGYYDYYKPEISPSICVVFTILIILVCIMLGAMICVARRMNKNHYFKKATRIIIPIAFFFTSQLVSFIIFLSSISKKDYLTKEEWLNENFTPYPKDYNFEQQEKQGGKYIEYPPNYISK